MIDATYKMISIENFYWVLFQNLLNPVGLDCWYYYPFGTQNNLNRNEFKPPHPHQDHHVLFHYDQEPLQNCDFGRYDDYHAAFSNKIVRILANSEQSMVKKDICKQRHMLDWYFFYHGFAALTWFRDCRFVDFDTAPRRVFSSLNHQGTDLRAYRLAIMARLLYRDLVRFGDVSLHVNQSEIEAELHSAHCRLSDRDKQLIQTQVLTKDCWPMILDSKEITGNASAHVGHHEYKLWQNSFVHVVNETVFYDAKLHLTEKIFKPMVALRPFVLAASPGNLAYLRSYGFKTFGDWWDESYDCIEDTDIRADMVVDVIDRLCAMSDRARLKMHEEMLPVLQFNKQHFFGKFRHIIVNELVDNFDQCIRIWNNGRVDGRELALHADPESVKQILLR